VSLVENVLRGEGITARNLRKTECPKGHGSYSVRPNGWRRCRECHRLAQAAYLARKSAGGAA
jgi:hypothetical protein